MLTFKQTVIRIYQMVIITTVADTLIPIQASISTNANPANPPVITLILYVLKFNIFSHQSQM